MGVLRRRGPGEVDHERGAPPNRGRVQGERRGGGDLWQQGPGGHRGRLGEQDRAERGGQQLRQGEKEEAEGVGEEAQGWAEEEDSLRRGEVGVGGPDRGTESHIFWVRAVSFPHPCAYLQTLACSAG